MRYEEDFRRAAKRADKGIKRAVSSLRRRLVAREDDFTGVLKGNLDAELEGQIGSIVWECTILNHSSGVGAEEKTYGADLLIHVHFSAPDLKYDKGILVQSKKLERGELIPDREHLRLIHQCGNMLSYSPASFVFVYSSSAVRCDSANHVVGSTTRLLFDDSPWTSYRFFLELFRCPIGDSGITSPFPKDLTTRATAKIVARKA